MRRAWAWAKEHPKQSMAIALIACNLVSAIAHASDPKAGRAVDAVIPLSVEQLAEALADGPTS